MRVVSCSGLEFKHIIPSYKYPGDVSGEEFSLSCAGAKGKLERS